MNIDRRQVDAIKAHFARKSSAQLQEVLRAEDPERWSPEASIAADEVLQDRLAGRAREPDVPEPERPPPPYPIDPYNLAFLGIGLFGGLAGLAIFSVPVVDYTGGADPDFPVPFGENVAWLAVDTTDIEAVASALGLRDARPAKWAEGIDAAYRSSVFVTPPLSDWTLAVGTALFPPGRAEAFIKPLLERLSGRFREAQYFGTHREVGLCIWARARQGELIRGYGWLGQKGLTLWDEGAPTREERDLGFRFVDGQPAADASSDENCVTQLANLWSIDPTILDEQFKEPVMGLLGSAALA